jgi:hypothetical protein
VIQLVILEGAKAGPPCVARHFPFLVGRSARAHLVLDGAGVWDDHARIDFQPGEGFLLEPCAGALVSVNGERTGRTRLRNGDLIECGSVKLRFWLAPFRQRGLRLREGLTWLALGALFAFQIGLVYVLAG